MAKYRKKPVVIEAVRWTGENRAEILAFSDVITWGSLQDDDRGLIEIKTLEGTMRADVGDWIIKGVRGEFYPCKPGIFAATYDDATLAAAGSELRPVVRAFAEAMEEKLRKNDHRGGWDAGDYGYIWRQLHEHLGKLTLDIATRQQTRYLPDAADVANLAMILCDILGVLPETAIASRSEATGAPWAE